MPKYPGSWSCCHFLSHLACTVIVQGSNVRFYCDNETFCSLAIACCRVRTMTLRWALPSIVSSVVDCCGHCLWVTPTVDNSLFWGYCQVTVTGNSCLTSILKRERQFLLRHPMACQGTHDPKSLCRYLFYCWASSLACGEDRRPG